MIAKAKQIYIAAPFFNPEQLEQVKAVERAILHTAGLAFYSPRRDGVLKDMTAAERIAAAPRIFAKNVEMLDACDAVLALKDNNDEGTIWETGYAYGKKPVFALRTESKPMNVMSAFCFDVIISPQQLETFLHGYAAGHRGGGFGRPPVETY